MREGGDIGVEFILVPNVLYRNGNPSNFWTGFGVGFLQESVQKKADSRRFRIRVPDSSNF